MAFTLRQVTAYTLADSVAAQKLFDANTTGAIDVVPGLYEFDGIVVVTAMSATSGNALIDIKGLGTATLARLLWHAEGFDATNYNAVGTASASFMNQSPSGVALLTAAVNTGLFAYLRGIFDCTVAGTIIPAITLLTGGVTPSVNANSFFTVKLRSQGTGQPIMSDEGYRIIISDVTVGSTRTITFSDGTVRVDKL